MNLRDQAMIRLYCNTGARLPEVANLRVDDIDWNTDSLVYQARAVKNALTRFRQAEAGGVQLHTSGSRKCVRHDDARTRPNGRTFYGP